MNRIGLRRILQFLLPSAALFWTMLFVMPCALAQESAAEQGLVFSEAQSNNDTEWALGFRDYVELFNGSDSVVMLSDYFISRTEEEPFACHLPAVELQPGAYALLICDVDLLDLRLPKEGCKLYLTHRDGALADAVELPAMENNVWQAGLGLTQSPSPGYPNTAEGAAAYRASLEQTLVISEVISSNSKLLPKDEEYNDLIELQNITDGAIELGQYYLSDKKSMPFMYRLPDVTLEAGECYVVQASGREAEHEAPFKISATGEAIYLNDVNGVCVDAMYVPELTPNTSYGRSEDAAAFYDTPSMGEPNPKGAQGITQTPQASIPSGPMSGIAEITLDGEGAIYYTLDGRVPTEKSARYDGRPIVIEQSAVLRIRALAQDKLWSSTRTYHYLYDAEKYELPLLCISAQPGGIFGVNGIYTNWEARNLEAPINLALIEEGEEKFSVDCGLKIHGQGSRALDKKSFQVRFRSKYGCGRLEYKLFEDVSVASFNALVLRSGSEDADRAFFRDEFQTSLTAQTMPEVLYQANRPVNLFIDGEYFGIYYIRERVTDSFGASHLGGTEEDIDMVKGWKNEEHGSRKDWISLMTYCKNHDLSIEENYRHVASQISLESFMDYYIARAYTGDRDYPNIRHVRSRGGDGLWRLVNFDLDWGFGTQPASFSQMIGKASETSGLNTVVINALLENAGFKDQMLTRMAWHFNHTYAPERVLAHLESMYEEVKNDMRYNHERWRLSYEKWEWHVQFLRDFVKNEKTDRVATMVQSAKRAFRLNDEEMTHYFGNLYVPQE